MYGSGANDSLALAHGARGKPVDPGSRRGGQRDIADPGPLATRDALCRVAPRCMRLGAVALAQIPRNASTHTSKCSVTYMMIPTIVGCRRSFSSYGLGAFHRAEPETSTGGHSAPLLHRDMLVLCEKAEFLRSFSLLFLPGGVMLAVQAREEVKPKLERRATVGSLFRRGLLRQEACRECGWQDAARCCGRAWHRASPTAPERAAPSLSEDQVCFPMR